MKLYCTSCKEESEFLPQNSRCPKCGEPLEAELIHSGGLNPTSRSGYAARYSDFYTFFEPEKLTSLGEGNTPLVHCGVVGKELGFPEGTLFLKNETENPTWSFKDRGTVLCANFAARNGYKAIGVVSAGNNAASCGAYAAALGLNAYVFVPDDIPEEKILPITIYGSTTVIKVKGDYSAIYPLSKKLEEKYGVYFANSDVPPRIEGTKSIAYEICEQMDFDPPEWVLVPTGSGGDLRGIEKGFREFQAAGFIKRCPKIVAVQSEGCCPIYQAFNGNKDRISHFGQPHTIAKGAANPFPPSGNQVLRLIKEGRVFSVEMVQEKNILKSQQMMARTGIFGQPASCMGFAAAKQLLDKGVIHAGERVVAIVTSSGLKVPSVLSEASSKKVYIEKLENLEEKLGEII